jgi:hypothetical protein
MNCCHVNTTPSLCVLSQLYVTTVALFFLKLTRAHTTYFVYLTKCFDMVYPVSQREPNVQTSRSQIHNTTVHGSLWSVTPYTIIHQHQWTLHKHNTTMLHVIGKWTTPDHAKSTVYTNTRGRHKKPNTKHRISRNWNRIHRSILNGD